MDRPPRNSATDRLVNRKLMSFAYLQIGVMQALAGFFSYFMVLNDYGYSPKVLLSQGLAWNLGSLMCTLESNGEPAKCGFACETFRSNDALEGDVCQDGCEIPTPGFGNPFSREHRGRLPRLLVPQLRRGHRQQQQRRRGRLRPQLRLVRGQQGQPRLQRHRAPHGGRHCHV